VQPGIVDESVRDVQNYVLVGAFAAHPNPEWAFLADTDGDGGLTFERAGKRHRSKGAPAGDLCGRNEVVPDSRRYDPRLVALVVGAEDRCPDHDLEHSVPDHRDRFALPSVLTIGTYLTTKPTASGPLRSNTTRS
jgi:hypothetical protein